MSDTPLAADELRQSTFIYKDGDWKIPLQAILACLPPKDIDCLAAFIEANRAQAVRAAEERAAGNIYHMAEEILFKRPASAIVAGGTDLDRLMADLERKYGKDLIQHVYGDHNDAAEKAEVK